MRDAAGELDTEYQVHASFAPAASLALQLPI